MALLGVEPSEEHKAVLRGLGNGECIFRDLDGRAGRIGIDLISDELRRRLDTNPTRARPAAAGPPVAVAHEPHPVVSPPGVPHHAALHAAASHQPAPQPADSSPPAG
jgi:hypothetical protein